MLRKTSQDDPVGLLLALACDPPYKNHSKCTSERCVAQYLDKLLENLVKDPSQGQRIGQEIFELNETAPRPRPLHREHDCCCDPVEVEGGLSKIAETIADGYIPLFTYNSGKLQIHRRDLNSTKFIVFSHVWTDG